MRCLLAADLDVPSEGIHRVMHRLGIELVEVDRIGVDWLTQSITPPIDFVCAVLRAQDDRDAEAAVLVDIGVALGRRIPVFVIVEPPRKAPLVVAGLTRVEAKLSNEEALELHLLQFLRAIRRKSESRKGADEGPALSAAEADLAHMRLRELRDVNADPGQALARFERLMLDLLTSAAEVSEPHESGHVNRQLADVGYDIAIWANSASAVLGGPVLVQTKLWQDPPRHGLSAAIDKFAEQLSKHQAPLGILIYHYLADYDSKQTVVNSSRPPIVVVSAHELVSLMSNQSLNRLLISMRNAIVHGVPYRG